jgi:hypothetical protein
MKDMKTDLKRDMAELKTEMREIRGVLFQAFVSQGRFAGDGGADSHSHGGAVVPKFEAEPPRSPP